MSEKKYGQYVKELVFKDYGPDSYRQGIIMDSQFLGMDAQIEFGTYWSAGKIGGKSAGPHTHDFDQLMFFFGADTRDMSELGAEVEFYMGPEPEKHMITSSTSVFIPKGFPHFPGNIARMEKRFICLTVSCAAKYQETPATLENKPEDVQPKFFFFDKYHDRVVQAPFLRKGAWSYGPTNMDDAGGALAAIKSNDIATMIMCESLKKAPYRFGPDPEKPHAHTQPEVLIFMGADTNDLSILGGEVEFALGKEQERHIINKPTAFVIPAKFAHCPVTITKVDKPFILCDCRPFGTGVPNAKSL
jgi:hypothetical protein